MPSTTDIFIPCEDCKELHGRHPTTDGRVVCDDCAMKRIVAALSKLTGEKVVAVPKKEGS